MEAAMVEMSASEPRERLLAFVDEVVRPLPHVRQRENALLYVRGLIEHGGRKSLQPTLFRLEETPAPSGSRHGSASRLGSSTTPGSAKTASTRRG